MKRSWSEVSTETDTDNKRRKLMLDVPETCNDNTNNKETHHNDDEAKHEIKTNNATTKTAQEPLSFSDKLILAPMVRVGTFPMRLMALKYGADIVYNQELIDHKVVRFIRKPNLKYQCIDFLDKSNNKLEFRTFGDEKVVFQIGSSDAVRCLKACNIISNDVLGIDLNMGCPKKFSMLGGMGAALLTKPETVEDIIKTLKRNVRNNLSVTCKIRLLQDDALTLELCRRLEKLNINALAIHARYVADRTRRVARIKLIKPITDCLQIPCIYNGDVYRHSDIQIAKDLSGCSSVMIGRGAQWNVSVFSKSNKLERLDRIVNEYLDISEKYDNIFYNGKWVAIKMICGRRWLCKSDVVIPAWRKARNWKDCYAALKLLTTALDERSKKVENERQNIYTEPTVFTTQL